MHLVEQRNRWAREFRQGKKPLSKALDDYKDNRNSEGWRSTMLMEHLCEYIIYLEEQLKTKENK